MLSFCSVLLIAFLAGAGIPQARNVTIVAAPDAPVRIEGLKLLNTDAEPLVLLYAAVNLTDNPFEQFTVSVFVFDREGRLKAQQLAPGRRTLNARETKYSTMVLDVGKIDATDRLMAGVDQAQRAGSEAWWRADLRPIAVAAAGPTGAAAPK
jgi:hypothetical protein